MRNHTSSVVDIVSAEQYRIVMETCWPVWMLLSLVGAVSNIINIRIFIVMGLNDGVIVTFLALAFTDLIYLLITFTFGVLTLLFTIGYRNKVLFVVDPYALTVFMFNVMIIINIANMLVTTFLAVARCMCVARPLQFKNTFTTGRSIVLILLF